MNTFLILVSLIGLAYGQNQFNGRNNGNFANAKTLMEARYQTGDGSFGSAYVQDDGTEFKEETTADGTRKGQYSYIDMDGKKTTVHYTAGKDGFQVTGDHLPKAPQPLPVPQQQLQQQNPAPRRQHQRKQQNYNNNNNNNNNYDQIVPQYNSQPQYNSIPQQNAFQQMFQQAQQYNNNNNNNNNNLNQQQSPNSFSYSFGEDLNNGNNGNAPFGSRGNYNNNNNGQYQQQQQQPQQQYNNYQSFQTTSTTPAPQRFFPPGKLNLNRTPDGYQYSFSSM